jgi:hypothetical protein
MLSGMLLISIEIKSMIKLNTSLFLTYLTTLKNKKKKMEPLKSRKKKSSLMKVNKKLLNIIKKN